MSRRHAVHLVIFGVLVAAPGVVAASPGSPTGVRPAGCTTCSPDPHGSAGSIGMGRTAYLVAGGAISIGFAAGDAAWLMYTGKQNGTLAGLGLLAGVPLALWGADYVAHDKGDVAAWSVTAGASALVVWGLWPVVDIYVLGHGDDSGKRAFSVAPTMLIGPSETIGSGLGIHGRF
jgi:hypothetical protein